MSKSIEKVFRAFENSDYATAGNFNTRNGIIYSYAMPIARKVGDKVYIIDRSKSPSVTTSKHIGYVHSEYPNAEIVNSLD